MKNLITYLKTLWRRGLDSQRKKIGVTLGEATIEQPFSTYSAPFGTCWQPSGKLHSVVRCAAMLVMLFTIGVGNAWGDTWTWTASGGGNLGTSNGSVTLNGKTWSVNRSSWAQSGTMNNGCYQCGSKNNPSTLTLSTSAFSTYTITQIDVVCSSYGGNHNIAMTVGASSFLAATATASGDGSAAANKSGSGSASGDITISFTQRSSSWRAMYIKSITITYSAAASKTLSSIAITTQPTTRKYLVGETFSKTGAVVTATYSDATTANVSTSATWTPTGALTAGTSKTVTASYTEGGVTKTATTTIDVYSVTVQKKDEDGTTIADAGVSASVSGRSLTASAGATKYVFKTWKFGTASGTSIASAGSASTSLTGTPTAAVTVIAEFYKPVTVTWNKNGSVYETTTVARGSKPVFPDNPSSCDATSTAFYGWATSTWENTVDNLAGKTVYTSAGDMPDVTTPVTYNAVFAKATAGATSWTKENSSISAGDVIILVNETASKELSGVGLISTTSCGLASDYVTTPAGTFPLTVETGNGGKNFSFKNGTNYLSWSSGNSLITSATKDNASSWTVNNPASGNFTFSNVGTTDRKLQYNSGSPRFCCYTSSQTVFQIYKRTTSYTYSKYLTTCCSDPGLAYGTGSVTKTYGASAFTNPLTNSHSVAVTYSSSDPTVATVNGSGQVTILKAGSTTITASSVAQTVAAVSYCADEASYTLTVNKASISPTLTYTPNSVAVGESTSAPTVGANPGSGGVTYAITTASPSGCATINTSTGVVTGVAVGSVTVTATVAATTNYNGGSATANVTITAASYFTNGATVFVQAESSSAWDASACVKAWFNASGAGGSAQTTYWLFDATAPDAGKKLFATIVPETGDLNQVTLQRFASNCSDFWNNNGTLTKASDGGSNTFRSTGSGNSNVAWNGSGITLSLYGDPNSWASSLGTFADQGNGVWTATYNNYAPANAAGESQEFKISTNYNGWIGNTGSNNNATLDGMHVGSTYNITATLDVKDHSLTMSKTFVKGTVHFDLQGHGSAISDLTNVAAGSKISAPSAPSATGWDFGGWYKEPACTNAWNFASDVVNETMTLYAKWTTHEYTITKTLTNVTSSPAIPSTYTYTGAAAGLNYTISPSDGYRLPTEITVSGTTYTWNPATGALALTGTISSNVTITIVAVQTHTVTWKSNGENYGDPVVYDHGAALVLPASDPSAPSSCSDKVFVGWTAHSEITSETSDAPELISAGGAVNADATYRAVFADEEGGGTKWVLTSLNAVTAGTYAILNQNNKAFTGVVNASGHGDVTAGAFSFTDGEASTAPTGTLEITFTAVTGGFTMYNSTYGYLYATKAASGGLSWHATESSYWTYASSNWKYNSNSAFLRSYSVTGESTSGGIRTYGNNSGDGVIKLAKKTGGISYDNYITQCCALKPVTNLAVSSSTANSVTLSWTAPSPTTGIDHLELRNASTDAKIGSNIAVGTTSTSVSGLTECETYSYKIVSVGASCETSSDAIEAQPFSGAKTVTFDYNGGSGSPTSFTTSCAGNTVALPTPDTRAGYTFLGWWSAQFGGVKQGDAGDIYTVSGTTTLWAHWSETNYTVTMAQSPAAGAELTGGTTTAHYGGTINISTTVPSGYRFTGWTASPSVTFADASATSTSFTMPNSNVTVTANFVQVHTLTFVVPTGGGSAVTPPATADHGGTVTLPNVTGIAAEYSCETFLGWTTTAPNAEGGTKWSSTPTIKAAGATSDVINSNTTFYAVYSRSGGGASGTVELDAAAITAIGTAGGHAYADAEWSITAADLSSWAARAYVGNKGTYLQIKEDAAVYIKLPTVGGNYRSISLNHNSNSSSRTIVYRTTTGGSNVASCTTPAYGTSSTIDIASGTTGGYIMMTGSYTYQIASITASYGPAPIISHALHCDCPITQFDLTYNANTGRFPGSTISCDDVDDYAWAAHDDIYTICATEPTCEGYKFIDWTTNANGSGDHYNAGQEISCVSTADVTLYAQYERVYTVTFDNQGVTTPVTQASYGATIAVPSATTPCDAEWAFVGWSETAIAPMSFMPTLEITAGTSTYTPTADKTLYAIYRKTSESSPFVAGMSGAYKISNGSTVYAGACNSSKLPETNAAGAYVFYIKYISADGGKYTIQQADGKYLKYAGESTSLALDDETPYYWTMTKNGDLWHVLGVGSGRYLQHSSGTGFKAYNGSGYTDIAFVAAEGQYYYRTMSCADEFDITFHDNGTTINWAEGHPEATYKDLADATVVSTFPTATFDGWTFLGWRTADYDESTTAPAASGIYSTGGNALTISSADVDLYPVFTRFEDNPPFDEINGGDYYIYFLDESSDDGYGAARRVYASSYADHKRYNSTAICASATEFTFTKLENGNWTIYDKTTSKYLYAEGDDWLQQKAGTANAEWTLTVNGNAFDAYCVGTSYGQISAYGNGLSATFENYARSNIGVNPSYHRVYLGGCTNRTFTTNPSTTPYITMNGEVAPITSSQNGAVRATNVLSVSGGNFTPSTGEITISSNNSDVYFSLSADKNFAKGVSDQPKLSVTITANGSGIVTPTPIYVHYKPSSNTDTWTSATITASYPGAVDQTATVELRTVKENFVIASKVGDNWYALPANMTTGSVYEPVLIDVDESAKIAYGPATVGYKMWPVQTVNGGTDEYATNGDKVRFAGNGAAGLWASNSNNNIRDWSTITAIGSTTTPPAAYEWIIETEDRNAYTLKSMYSTNYLDLYRPSSGTYAGKLVWASNNTYETNEIHFFPLEERAMITIIPREWKANGLVFSVAADNQITAASYKIGTGSETSTTYTRHSTGGYGLYEVALPDLTSQYGKLLTLKLTISGTPTYATTTIPIIVNANASTKTNEPFATLGDATKDYDVVVLDGKTLTTDAVASGACKFQNLYIYPGATLVNAANNNLSVRYLELRGGIKGIDHKSDLAQGVPHLKLDKNFSSTAGANLDMYVNTAHSYALSVPFDVTLSTVNFANSLNTETSEPINGTLDAQFMIMEYDGAQRASTGKGWKHITSTERVLHAGEGYVLQGKRPKGQPFAVIRFPFSSVSGWADGSGEVVKSAVSISEHAGGASTPDNDKGWNLIANPYMATLSYNGADEGWAADFTVGSLVKTDTDPWDGKYDWESTTNAYVTMPNEWYTEFPQYRANSAQAVFEPFKNFFIQASANGSVTFDKSKRASAPRHLLAQVAKAQPIYADINLTHGEAFAQAGLIVDENATAGYKFGEDQNIFENREALTYLKVYTVADGHYLVGNTMTPAETEELIPVEFYAPNAGEYIFSLDDNSDIDRLEYVILYDAVLGLNTNLLTNDYMVDLEETGLIENRFSIGLRIKEKDNSATGIGDVSGDPERPYKFIYRDKMYILRGGKIYDATGKQVREINK